MKRQIRQGVFETNSSSVHSMTICMKSDYDKWVNNELVFDDWNDELVEITPEIKNKMESRTGRYLTHEQFHDWEYLEYETFESTFKTENNDEVVAFGYYGHD